MYEPTRKDGPDAKTRSLAISSIIAALRELPPEQRENVNPETAAPFLRNVYKWYTAASVLSETLKPELEKAEASASRPQVYGAFARAFLDCVRDGQAASGEEARRSVLEAFRRYLKDPQTSTAGPEAAKVLKRSGVDIDKFYYNNTRVRHKLDATDKWVTEFFEKRYDLTDGKRKKKKGPQDVVYICLSPETGEPSYNVQYKFKRDAELCQDTEDAIASIYLNGHRDFIVSDIGRFFAGRMDAKDVNPRLKERITEAIEQLRSTRATITSPRLTIKGKDGEKRPIEYHENLLYLSDFDIPLGGSTVKVYHIIAEPVKSKFSGDIGERVEIPFKYFDIREIGEGVDHAPYPMTDQRRKIRNYILVRIQRARGQNTGAQNYATKLERKTHWKKRPMQAAEAAKRTQDRQTKASNLSHIRMDTIYEMIGAKSTTQKAAADRDAETVLKWLKFNSPEFLKNYTVKTERVKNDPSSRGRYKTVKVFILEF